MSKELQLTPKRIAVNAEGNRIAAQARGWVVLKGGKKWHLPRAFVPGTRRQFRCASTASSPRFNERAVVPRVTETRQLTTLRSGVRRHWTGI